MVAIENDFDFLSIADEKGNVVARAFVQEGKTTNIKDDSLIAAAIGGMESSGVKLVSSERLAAENPALIQKLGAEAKTGMVIEAAHPLLIGGKTAATLYGGILLNNNALIADRISHRLFRGEVYDTKEVGYVSIYQGDRTISTTLKGKEGLPLVGTQADQQIREKVLGKGLPEITEESQIGAKYLCAAEAVQRLGRKNCGCDSGCHT